MLCVGVLHSTKRSSTPETHRLAPLSPLSTTTLATFTIANLAPPRRANTASARGGLRAPARLPTWSRGKLDPRPLRDKRRLHSPIYVARLSEVWRQTWNTERIAEAEVRKDAARLMLLRNR